MASTIGLMLCFEGMGVVMSHDRLRMLKVQCLIYAAETMLVAGVLSVAAALSPDLGLGLGARTAIAASFPLPCHLVFQTCLLLQKRPHRLAPQQRDVAVGALVPGFRPLSRPSPVQARG